MQLTVIKRQQTFCACVFIYNVRVCALVGSYHYYEPFLVLTFLFPPWNLLYDSVSLAATRRCCLVTNNWSVRAPLI